jgi:serine protease Do
VPLEPEPTQPPGGEASSPDDFGVEVSFIDEALRDQLELPGDAGVIVRTVTVGSPAAKAGLAEHDVVLSINGEPVKTKWDFRRLLIEGTTGGKLELAIVREGEEKTLTVDPALLKK